MLRVNQFYDQSLFAMLLVAASGVASAAEPVGKNWYCDWNSARRESQVQGRPMLLFVTMDHCYYCTKMCQETFGDSRVMQDIERDFLLTRIQSESNPDLVRKLNVRLFPTTVIVGPDETVIDSMSGYVGPEQLRSRLKSAGQKTVRR